MKHLSAKLPFYFIAFVVSGKYSNNNLFYLFFLPSFQCLLLHFQLVTVISLRDVLVKIILT